MLELVCQLCLNSLKFDNLRTWRWSLHAKNSVEYAKSQSYYNFCCFKAWNFTEQWRPEGMSSIRTILTVRNDLNGHLVVRYQNLAPVPCEFWRCSCFLPDFVKDMKMIPIPQVCPQERSYNLTSFHKWTRLSAPEAPLAPINFVKKVFKIRRIGTLRMKRSNNLILTLKSGI